MDRHLLFEACANFRDLGGYETADGRSLRWRRLFRADSLHRLSDIDLEQARQLGLRTVIDLRAFGELKRAGGYPVDRHEVTVHHLPMFATLKQMGDILDDWPDDAPPGQIYVVMAAEGPESIASALRLLAVPETYPAVFHCTVGKDRTGILASLVLSLLGVPDETIIDDYVLTQRSLDQVARTGAEVTVASGGHDRFPADAIGAQPRVMRGFLDLLRLEHGSVEAYVRSIGIGNNVIDGLRAELLE
jgi:protein-tyrosine phosphatase